MRLTVTEKKVISSSAKQIFGSETKVVLFGSRANDSSRGGDIDLLIIPPEDSIRSEFFNKKLDLNRGQLKNLKEIREKSHFEKAQIGAALLFDAIFEFM